MQAVVEGATLRFRPVMMTATVAMLGLIPFLFATGRVPKCSDRWPSW
jgi:cobalt-zinc-cadmium resistance protein CzcA